MTAKTDRTRIPQGQLEKARFYAAMAEAELARARLQSVESFLRLAAFMDPANVEVASRLRAVVSQRGQLRAAHP